jgi:hypothetical protein
VQRKEGKAIGGNRGMTYWALSIWWIMPVHTIYAGPLAVIIVKATAGLHKSYRKVLTKQHTTLVFL